MKTDQRGFTLIELMIVVAIILIISAITVPHLLRSKMTANETAALGRLNTLNNMLFDYWTNYETYPPSLSNLDPNDSALLDGSHGGYVFTYTCGQPDRERGSQSYLIKAVPIAPGTSGRRYFFTDQSGLIRADLTDTSTLSGSPVN